MGLTALIDVKKYNLSKSPIIGQYQTDKYKTAPGLITKVEVFPATINGANSIGGSLQFSWALNTVTFTIAATPDDSGNQVRPKYALSDAAYAIQLAEDFNKNQTLNKNFKIYVPVGAPTNIYIEALNVGPQFTFENVLTGLNFGYEYIVTIDGADAVYSPNYKMCAELYMESEHLNDAYKLIATNELDPINDTCTFYFQDQINANLSHDLPTLASTDPFICKNVLKRFYIKYYERFGTPPVNRMVNASLPSTSIKIGIAKHEYDNLQNALSNFFQNKFLTKQPLIKKVALYQDDFLYIYIFGTAFIRTTVSLEDGTVTTLDLPTTTGIAGQYTLCCFPVGANANNMQLVGKFPTDIVKYTVQVISQDSISGTPVESPTFTFIIDQDYYLNDYYIYFTNSLAGLDTLRVKGVLETAFEMEKDTFQKIFLPTTPIVNGEFGESGHEKTERYKVATGWLTKQEADWLEDLFLSEQKFIRYTDSFGLKLMPIIISTTVFKKYDTETTLFSYTFEFSTAFKNNTSNFKL